MLDDGDVALVESSPVLQAAQRDKLKAAAADIVWVERFDDALAQRPLFLVANEFFDCLPLRQFVKTDRGWRERLVTADGGRLAFALAPAVATAIPGDRSDAPDGGVWELAPAALALAEEIARAVSARGGAALVIDYGYDTPGFGETLQALAHGEYVDVLAEPGDSDLSAHVDFAALARAGAAGGAQVHGPVTQCNFLAELGIGPRAERLMIANPQQARDIAAAVDRLVNPEKMGALFKVLAFAPDNAPPPPGFSL